MESRCGVGESVMEYFGSEWSHVNTVMKIRDLYPEEMFLWLKEVNFK